MPKRCVKGNVIHNGKCYKTPLWMSYMDNFSYDGTDKDFKMQRKRFPKKCEILEDDKDWVEMLCKVPMRSVRGMKEAKDIAKRWALFNDIEVFEVRDSKGRYVFDEHDIGWG